MYHDHIKGTSGSGTGGGLKSGSYVWLGMGVKKSEKLNKEFSDYERPHLTTDTHIKNNDKRNVALLLGELPSPRLYFVSQYIRGFMAKEVRMQVSISC